jgi:peptidoglycan hydrolase CwlO-like protein
MQHKFEESVIEDIKNMDQRLTELEEKIDSINTKLTQVVDAILGNPLTKTGGFMKELTALEEQIEALKKRICRQEEFRKKVYWFGGLTLTVILIVQYLTTIYKNLK